MYKNKQINKQKATNIHAKLDVFSLFILYNLPHVVRLVKQTKKNVFYKVISGCLLFVNVINIGSTFLHA